MNCCGSILSLSIGSLMYPVFFPFTIYNSHTASITANEAYNMHQWERIWFPQWELQTYKT